MNNNKMGKKFTSGQRERIDPANGFHENNSTLMDVEYLKKARK